MNTTPDVTEEDIRRSMNFERLLVLVAEHRRRQQKIREKVRPVLITVAVFTIAGFASWYFLHARQVPSQRQAVVSPGASDTSAIPKTLPIQKKPQAEHKKEAAGMAERKRKVRLPVEKPVVTIAPYVAAEPEQGFPAFYDYINRELRYPAEAIIDSVQGVVTIRFVVSADGKAGQFTILKPLHPACDKEALRVVQQMPAWKPAMLDGKAVDSKITVPLTFSFKTIHH